jgi:predicted enzyme related to lactoylglutathione lyase
MTALSTPGCASDEDSTTDESDNLPDGGETNISSDTQEGGTMRVHYLEIVTKDVDAACKLYSAVHGVTFGDADQSLGGARTAQMTEGGMMGIRAPMHDGENSVTRPYILVEDIEAAVGAAAESGAEIAVPPMKIPGHGTCAIYIHGGIEAGLWQL